MIINLLSEKSRVFFLKILKSAIFSVMLFQASSCCYLIAINKNTPVKPSIIFGDAGMQGRIKSRRTNQPIKNVLVRLAEVYRKGNAGAFVLDDAHSPGNYTNEAGHFTIQKIKSKEYVMVIGDVMGTYEIIKDISGKAKVWKLEPNEIRDVGDVLVNLTNG